MAAQSSYQVAFIKKRNYDNGDIIYIYIYMNIHDIYIHHTPTSSSFYV